MSERKTAEIKFRVAPSEKAAWQRYAESAQLGLSELIRREVNEGIRANEAKQSAEFRAGVDAAREALEAGPEAVLAFLTEGDADIVERGSVLETWGKVNQSIIKHGLQKSGIAKLIDEQREPAGRLDDLKPTEPPAQPEREPWMFGG